MYRYIDYSKPPFIEISLPPAIVIHAIPLITLYAIILGLDLYLLYHEQQFRKNISPKQLRLAMTILHIAIPMLFITGYPPLDLLFAGAPWFLASYSAHIPTDQLNILQWIHTISTVIIDNDDSSKNKKSIRYNGISKLSLAIFKIAVMHIIVDPFLPRRPEHALEYAWFSFESLFYTALFGIKAYLLLGVVEIYMSIYQILFGWNIVDLFNSPIIASSPRDFWSRRWNKIVRNLLHTQVFTRKIDQDDDHNLQSSAKPTISTSVPKKQITKKKTTKKTTTTTKRVTRRVTRSSTKASTEPLIENISDDIHLIDTTEDTPVIVAHNDEQPADHVMVINKEPRSFWSTRHGRGLLSFIISGLFHELIIMSVCRKMTLENFAFFTIQGLVVAIEVQLRQGALKQEPQGVTRLLCIAIQFLFMTITGRLFTGPFLRYNFFKID